MTKDRLAKKIIEMIDNFRFVGDDEKEVFEAVNSMLDSLEPKDRDSFCKWECQKTDLRRKIVGSKK